MALTLTDLRDRLRIRLGDPSGNFISSSVVYSGSSAIDEEATIINDAARQLAADLYRNGIAMLTDRKQLAIEPNKSEYALPADMLGVQEVFWEQDSTRYEVAQKPLQSFRSLQERGDRPLYFDVFGQTAEVIDVRICSGSSNSATVASIDVATDGDNQSGFTLAQITKNRDKIFNLSDGSSGTITAEGSSAITATAGLSGGQTNTFRTNDRVQIEKAEQTLPLLHVHPKIDDSSYSNVATGVATTFQPTTPYYLYGAKVTLSAVGSATHPLKVKLTDTTDAEVVDVTAIDSRSVGTHEVVFPNNKVLDTSKTYQLSVGDSGDTGNTLSSYDIIGFSGQEKMTIYYARYPLRMVNDEDTLELPEICIEAILERSVATASSKAEGGANQETAQSLAMYRMQLEELIQYQRTRNIRGSRQVKNVMYTRWW
tara:strand:+ start:33 stop:1313 length:1281 start_codon:yes stop_codon:yes gene_type:complete